MDGTKNMDYMGEKLIGILNINVYEINRIEWNMKKNKEMRKQKC